MPFSSICFKRSPRSLPGQTSANSGVVRGILRHPSSSPNASHQAMRRFAMKAHRGPGIRQYLILIAASLAVSISCAAQQPEGPQSDAPAPVAPKPAAAPQAGTRERITVPSGTRVGVVLQNGISTRSAKPGDSIYLQTSFPITQNNRIVIPVGSYLRGELLESKRPGKVKGKGEFRLRLDTLILVARKRWTPKVRSPAVVGKERTSAPSRRRQPPARELAPLPTERKDLALAQGSVRPQDWPPCF